MELATLKNGDVVEDTYQERLGQRLRAIRGQQGLTLQNVEESSNGRWKAVVVGSYERGDRAVSVPKLSELAEFYGVPLADLLPTSGPSVSQQVAEKPKMVVDLQRLGDIQDSSIFEIMRRYVSTVQRDRGDYNGRMITLREADLRSIAAACDQDPDLLISELSAVGALR